MKVKIELSDKDRIRDITDLMNTAKNWEFRCCLDPEKMKAYHDFLKRVSKDKVIVDLGSGNGVMAYIALQYGAKKVYCIDYNKAYTQVVKTNLQEYIDDGRVEVHHVNAINDSLEFIQDADIVVHEIFGHNVHDEYITKISMNLLRFGLLDKLYPKLIDWYRVNESTKPASKKAVKYFKSNYPDVVADFHELHSKRIESIDVIHNTMPCLEGDHESAEWLNLGRTRLDNMDLMRYVPKGLEEIKSNQDYTDKGYFFSWKCYFDETEQEHYRGGGRQLCNWGYMPGPGGSHKRFIESIRFGDNINPHVSI
jgi:SAM-dependent methyltransferase|tara:strand:- start:6588 stop:7514 length:927 start_codon:yes stop_codon:yes gene_type:complete